MKLSGVLLILHRERMYKTRFQSWGTKKYRVHKITKSTNEEIERRHAAAKETNVFRERRPPNSTELQHGLQNHDLAENLRPNRRGRPNRDRAFQSPTSSSIHLAIPLSHTSSQHTAISSVINTPDSSWAYSPLSGSDKFSLMTPESSGSSNGNWPPQLSPFRSDTASNTRQGGFGSTVRQRGLGSDTPSTIRPSGIETRHDPEPFTARANWVHDIPRNDPQRRSQATHSSDEELESQIVDQVMGYSSPSTFPSPTPPESLRNLMTTPLNDPLRRVVTFRNESDNNRQVTGQDLNLTSLQPETWTSLCFHINVYLALAQTSAARPAMEYRSAARHAMECASVVYEALVQQRNDQILSILNLILAILFLHRQAELAVELLSQAQAAASRHLQPDDPIMVSIAFMIAIAKKKSKQCSILKLRQVAHQMSNRWGENHRYCITADYHLAWRLAMESESRREALMILQQTQSRSERVFDPLHMQTVALITTQARVLGSLGYHVEAEQTMSRALHRIMRWQITADFPYYIEAKRRHQVFVEELARRRPR